MTIENIITLCWVIIVFIAEIIALFVGIHALKIAKENQHQKKAEFFMKEFTVQKIEDTQKMLDMLITECFDDYLANNPEYVSSTYITEEIELKIIKDIADRVSLRMSEGLFRRLTMYYNERVITDLIAEKVYLKVTNFIVSINMTK